MIISTKILMKWNSYNKKYYINLGYEFTKIGDLFELKIKDLNKNSHYKIKVKCSYCNKIKEIQYKQYCNSLKNKNFYVCSKCRFQKIKVTNIERYNVENISNSEFVKNKLKIISKNNWKDRKLKIEKTNISKFGCKNPFQNEKIIEIIKEKTRNTKIKKGLICDDSNLPDFIKYKRLVINLTHKNKKELFKNWNGYDYYDGEYIKDNFKYNHHDSLYPNVDHKISIKYGFENNILPTIIADINNLCITKKKLNLLKGIKNYL